jgi:hypothetical protein
MATPLSEIKATVQASAKWVFLSLILAGLLLFNISLILFIATIIKSLVA